MPTTVPSREIRLAARPKGEPAPTDFALAETEAGPPADGQVLVRNRYMSVDPYMRGRMNDARSYVPPFRLGEPLEGGAVGEVVESRAEGVATGDLVLSNSGWREAFVAEARRLRVLPAGGGVDPAHHLGALGMPGFTAWIGLHEIAGVQAGDTVFVSAAAGAVGSMAGQLARLAGATTIGSAGGPEKVALLRDELGYDHAFDHREADPVQALAEAAPEGIDVYFDNVGGPQLEAAIGAMRRDGRIALCGMVSQYNATSPAPGPANLALAVGKRLTLRGFIVSDHGARNAEFLAEVGPRVASGEIRTPMTMVDGIERAPEAFIGLLRGTHRGKVLVRL
jgi:NADPH-dependent curcumin reductase CurA